MKVTTSNFGTTSKGQQVTLYRLENSAGCYVNILDLGCIIQSAFFPDRNGKLTDVGLGYDNVEQYETCGGYFGAVVGRHANRIKDGHFVLNGKTYQLAANDRGNHLHGGLEGFHLKVFECLGYDGEKIRFRYISPDGEEGYPGMLELVVTYQLSDDNEFSLNYHAVSDADTVINITNHIYFNLSGEGGGDILDHTLKVYASKYTENDARCLPTGVISDVAGTPFDFRDAKPLVRDIAADHEQIRFGNGYDQNFVVDGEGMRPAAELVSPKTGIIMYTNTTKPGVQIYTANSFPERPGKTAAYGNHCGVCIETQYFPNAMENPHFPSAVLRAGEVYDYTTVYKFGTV
jgi:Galactose mutarotase and related enzymes